MARAIDAYAAIDMIDEWLDSVGTVMVGKGLSSYGELIGCIEDTPTLTPPNEPLTLEQLREMDKITPVWWTWNGCWCLCERGYITTPNGDVYGADEMNGLFYRRPLEGEVDGK